MPDSKHTPKIIQPDIAIPQALMSGEIHFYVMPIAELAQDEALLISYVNEEEKTKANRYLKHEHGQQYLWVRGMLRKQLSHYLDIKPQAVEFNYAEHGKPSLRNKSPIYFNLSHSRDMVVYAFSFDHELGVDIEYMREQKNLEGMIRHVGSLQEQEELKSLNETEAYDAFYRLWTRKEAFIKAVGQGLSMGLRSIHIGTRASSSPISVEYKNEYLSEWFLQDINPPRGYKLALCSKYLDI